MAVLYEYKTKIILKKLGLYMDIVSATFKNFNTTINVSVLKKRYKIKKK